jgi:ABC-type transport system involved in multi-copper enzyme maturation permease subunit/alpha-tubulin suppressor-like RCC1 family protein
MNALIAKEMRLLLPAYGMALVLAVIPVWLLGTFDNQPVADTIWLFWLGAVLLALSTFGREFGLNTFPLLLAQPLERRRIWWTKTVVLAGAMATVLAAWYLSCAACVYVGPDRTGSPDMLILVGTAAVVAFTGGLWTTLLLRQGVAAFWFTMLVPGAIMVAIGMNGGENRTILAAMIVYSVAGFLWAWRLFLRAQEVGWTGGIVNLSGWWRAAAAASRPSLRVRRPLAALCWKELQLHQIGLAGMGCLFGLHLGVVALRHAALGSTMSSALEVFGGIWLIVPLVAASSSVAEERKLGTLDAHLCLPISSRVQFAVKLLFVLVLGGLLSAVLLWTAEGIGGAIGAGSRFKGPLEIPFGGEALALVSLAFLALSLIGFYASTLTRNVIQALATAVVTALGVMMFGGIASDPLDAFGLFLWQGALVYYFGGPTLIAIFVWLAWRNFRCVSESGRLWRRNALGLIGALVFTATCTSALYHRAWELLTPIEPAHGPARLVGAKPTILHGSSWSGVLSALLPSGGLWVDRFTYDPGRPWLAFGESTGFRVGGKWISLSGNHIVAGSNWVAVAASFQETVAIRSDGTLWISEKPRQAREDSDKGIPPSEEPAGLVRFGDETNWQSVACYYWNGSRSVVLLKTDGTLWRWSETTNAVSKQLRKWPGLRSFQPHRLGTESDWARVMSGTGSIFVWKRDGRAWVLHPANRNLIEVELEPGTVIERLESFDNLKWRSLTRCEPLHVAVREDGTMWAWRFLRAKKGAALSMRPPVQIGKDTNWVAVAGDYNTLAALKTDGSIWQWQWDYGNDFRPRWRWRYYNELRAGIWLTKVSPVRLGAHADWVAVGSVMNGIVSLAADGSLWYWWNRDLDWRSEYASQPMLAPSRKPAKIANILGQQE